MNQDLLVLRALAQLSRHGHQADAERLAIYAGLRRAEDRALVARSLRRLEGAGLIVRGVCSGSDAVAVRLTLAGLAVAVGADARMREQTRAQTIRPNPPPALRSARPRAA